MKPGLVSVGAVTGAHGVKGEVKLRSFTAEPRAITSYGALQTGTGVVMEIVRLRPRKDGFIAVIRGVSDRDQAEALKGTELFVPRERLPKPEANEVYLGDLVGLDVWQGDHKLGEVAAIWNFGAGDLIDVKIEGRSDTVLIPLAKGFLVSADVAAGRIVVDLPDGYLDEHGL